MSHHTQTLQHKSLTHIKSHRSETVGFDPASRNRLGSEKTDGQQSEVEPLEIDLREAENMADPCSENAAWFHVLLNETLRQIENLPKAQRDTLILVGLKGFTYVEAAEFLGVPIGTVMSRIFHARQKIKS